MLFYKNQDCYRQNKRCYTSTISRQNQLKLDIFAAITCTLSQPKCADISIIDFLLVRGEDKYKKKQIYACIKLSGR